MSTEAFVLAPGECRSGPARGGWVTRVGGADTHGLVAIGEAHMPPRSPGPSLHVHTNEDEVGLVVEGVLTVQLGDARHEVLAGGIAWLPRGVPHAFANLSDNVTHVVGLIVPSGLEGMFAEQAEYFSSLQGPPDPARLAEIAARYGVTMLGQAIPIPA